MLAESPEFAPVELNERRIIRAGLAVLGIIAGVLLLWMVLAPLSGAVIATGTVKVDNERKSVQHLEGGIVKQILVHNGDHVKTGQALVILEDESVDASVGLQLGQLYAELAKVSRLRAEKDYLHTLVFPKELLDRRGDPNVAEVMRGETHLFEVRRKALTEELALIQQQIVGTEHERDGLAAQRDAQERGVNFTKEQISANEGLVEKQFIAKTRLLDIKKELSIREADRAEHVANIARAEQKSAELRLRMLQLRKDYMQGAATELEQSTSKLQDIQERIRPSMDAQKRQTVVASVDGEVVNLRIFTTGGVIAPREPLMEIVPANTPLIVEAKVSIDDIDEVKTDMPADVRLTAYKYRSTMLVSGSVSYVSADRLIDEVTHQPYYAAHIRLEPAALKDAGDLHPTAGMPAEVFIRTGTRSLFDYFIEPVTSSLRRGMRES